MREVAREGYHHDFKSLLHERVQAQSRKTPHYKIAEELGADHDKTFEVGHAVLNRGVRAVEGYEIRVWAHRHPEDPNRLKAMSIPAEIKAAFE